MLRHTVAKISQTNLLKLSARYGVKNKFNFLKKIIKIVLEDELITLWSILHTERITSNYSSVVRVWCRRVGGMSVEWLAPVSWQGAAASPVLGGAARERRARSLRGARPARGFGSARWPRRARSDVEATKQSVSIPLHYLHPTISIKKEHFSSFLSVVSALICMVHSVQLLCSYTMRNSRHLSSQLL